MTCRSCGATIADKAIVCYRCGTSTADPAVTRVRVDRRSTGPNWTMAAALVVIVALGVWLIPMTPPASATRWGAWGGLVVAAVLAVLVLRRR